MLLQLLLGLVISSGSHAMEIPKGLSKADRIEVIETIGLGASPKMLTNPYPLGGYSGFEVGYSLEFINVRDVNRLGCTIGQPGCPNTHVSDDDEFRVSRLTIGKGLYHDIDVFVHFAPPIGGTIISDYGGSLRWAFYQAELLPITFSTVLSANRMNVQDNFINQNIAAELMMGITVDNFSLYLGGGQIWAKGTFMAHASPTDPGNGTVDPSDPSNDNLNNFSEYVQQTHIVVGIALQFQNLFSAAEIDHYKDSVYSLKIGTRF